MDEHLKKRLLGATVLVALGVIFIPALLDNRGDDRLTVKMEIPDKPDIEIEKPLRDLQKRTETSDQIDLPAPPKKKSIEKDVLADTQSSNPLDQDNTHKSDIPAKKVTVGQKVPMVNTKTIPQTTDQNIELEKKKPLSRQWVIQIGSFGQESNANGLVAKLRKANWKAYKESLDGVSGKVYRVRLGPIEERKLAENYRQQLIDLGYKHTIIMSYP